MKLKITFLFTLIFSLLVAGASFAQDADPYDAARTSARLEMWKAISSGLASSATVAIMDDGKIVYSETFGMRDREKSLPVDTHTQFNIGSVSKVFTATAILLLSDEGKVELDRPVTEYIPEFTMKDARYKDITVRMLLNHSSGFPGTYEKRSLGAAKNLAYARSTVASLAGEYLKHDPGVLSVYCNDGFTVAQEIIERVSGSTYSRYLSEHVFTKLGMNDTSCFFMEGNDNVAREYSSVTGLPLPKEYVSVMGSGGISSTANDLCRFSTAIYSNSLFKASTLEEFKKPQYGPETVPEGIPYFQYGLGWDSVSLDKFQRQGVTVLAKNGGTAEFSSQLYVAPDERLTVALSVTGPADVMAISDVIMQALLEGKGIVPVVPKPVLPTPQGIPIPDELLPFEGYYASENGIYKIMFDRVENTMSILAYADGVFALKSKYPYVEGGCFYASENYTLTFSENFGGKFLVSHYCGADGGVSIIAEGIPGLPPGIDGSAFDGKTWLPRNLSYDEIDYEGFEPRIEHSSLPAELPGYVIFSNCAYALADARTTAMNLSHMRDLKPPRLFDCDGGSWLYSSGFEYSDASLVRSLQPGEAITIGPKGYNEWRKAGTEMVFSSTMPATARILAWSPENEVFYDSMVDGKKDVLLPAGAYVGFVGPPGAVFTNSGDPTGNTYELTFLSASNGSITGTTPQTIDYGDSSEAVTATPDANYQFANWTGSGWFKTTTENPLTITDVESDRVITANFAQIVDISGISGGGRITIPALFDSKGGMKNMFVFSITTEKNFKLLTSGGTGNCDIYLRHGLAPDLGDYYKKATGKTTAEVLEIDNPEAGNWYVYLYPAADFADASLNIDVNSEVPDKPSITALISGTKVNLSWTATGTSYDVYRSLTDSTAGASVIMADTEMLSYQENFTGTYYYYWVKAKSSKFVESDFSNAAHPNGSDVIWKILYNGVPVTNISGASGTTKTCQIDVPAGQALLEIKAYGGKGEYELDACIDGSTETYRALIDSDMEPIRIENPEGGSYLIHLYGETDYSGVAIVAKYYGAAPLPVTGLAAGKGTDSDSISLCWTDSPGAIFYEVWRANANNIAGAENIGTVPDNSYVDNTNLESNVTYYYWIKAGNSKGVSKECASASGFLMKGPVAVPTGLKAGNGLRFDRISLSWPKYAGAASYVIRRNTVNNSAEAITLAEVESESNLAAYSYDNMGDDLAAGTKYYYFIMAKKDSGASGFSAGAIGMLKNSGPATIAASKGTCFGKVRISWSEIPGATGYDVYRYTDKGLLNNDKIFDAGGKLFYEDETAVKGTTYFYRAMAKYKDRYTSLFSPSAAGFHNDVVMALRAPVIKSASKGDYAYVRITWLAVPLAEDYKIYRNTVNQFLTSTLIATSAGTTYNDLSAAPDTVYWYWLKANNDTSDVTSVPSGAMSGFARSASTTILDGGTASVDASKGTYKFYSLDVPAGASRLVVTLSNTSPVNNCDLYAKLASYPSLSSYNAKGSDVAGGKTLTISNPAQGTWYILLYGKTDYANVTLSVRSYAASNIILTEVPADNLIPPYAVKFKGRVVDQAGKGIPGLSLQSRNPITGATSWLTAKTDAGGYWTFSSRIDREGAHSFDFFFTTLPDVAKGTAAHTVYTRKDSWEQEGLFDSSSYLPGLPSALMSAQTMSMQEYFNIRGGWDTGIPDASSEELWVEGTIGKTASDTAILRNLDDGLYLLFYAFDGTGCGNDLLPYPALRPYPLIVHVTPDKMNTVLDNLTALGIVGSTRKTEILAGNIGVVSIAALSNPDEDASGECDVSLMAREQLEALANLAMNNSSVQFLEDRQIGNVMAKIIKVKISGGAREFNVAADCIPVGSQAGVLKASYDKLINAGLTAVEDAGVFKFYDAAAKLIAEISGNQLIFKYGGFGGNMMMVEDRTTTVLGKYSDLLDGYGTKEVLSMPEGCFARESANPNGINILDIPAAIYDALLVKNIQKYLDEGKTLDEAKALAIIDGKNEFWALYNYPFLEEACQRGDNIRVLSNNAYYKNASDAVGGFYKREIGAIEDGWNGNQSLMLKYGYTFDAQTSTYKRIWK
ncbi:MAG TPA: hypothetical protein DET40_00720 [Lentisphaeria bacterium]|nr:MAG: hypothetical protein A2X45_16790 [Lentisphaerae bacterium GWF2_50_93]HCE42055.1 hypothetical protein [Lentisphaeria bacterium]